MANKKQTNYQNPNRPSRSYIEIVYPDSAPPNWKTLIKAAITNKKIRYALISPLHDRDKYTVEDEKEYLEKKEQGCLSPRELENPIKAGELKKPHYHIIIEFVSPTPLYYAEKYLQSITNGTKIKFRENLKGAVRYLAHLDENPKEKELYDPDLIEAYGDIEGKYHKFLENEDKSMSSLTAWKEIKDLIDTHCITSYYDFDNLMDEQDYTLQLQFQKNTRLATRTVHYINSRREEFSRKTPPSDKLIERALARRQLDRLVENGTVTLAFAEQQIKSLYEQIEGGKTS